MSGLGPKHCDGKCMHLSTLSPPKVSWIPHEIYDLAAIAAEELMAIALGEPPSWIRGNDGGNFGGKIMTLETDLARGAIRDEETKGEDNTAGRPSNEEAQEGLMEESEWLKDWRGWRCIGQLRNDCSCLTSRKPMAWMRGVCEKHGWRVEVVVEVLD